MKKIATLVIALCLSACAAKTPEVKRPTLWCLEGVSDLLEPGMAAICFDNQAQCQELATTVNGAVSGVQATCQKR